MNYKNQHANLTALYISRTDMHTIMLMRITVQLCTASKAPDMHLTHQTYKKRNKQTKKKHFSYNPQKGELKSKSLIKRSIFL